MNYFIAPANGELRQWVSHFWWARLDGCGKANPVYYATAHTRTELAFTYRYFSEKNIQLTGASVQGLTDQFGQFPMSGFNEVFGVSLHQHAIPVFFKLGPSELNNKFTSLKMLLGRDGEDLFGKMAAATDVQERTAVLSRHLSTRFHKEPKSDALVVAAIARIKALNGAIDIARLATEMHLSPKQFTRRFHAYTGLNPKHYAQISRFEQVLARFQKHQSFSESTYEGGYYDQSHFIADFRRFSGFSPRRFFALTRE